MYQKLYEVVSNEISQLRVVLEGVEAREKERVWVKNQIQVPSLGSVPPLSLLVIIG